MQPEQMMKDIPMINQKLTRRAVYAYLAVYRRYIHQLENGIDFQPLPTKPGFEHAMDPDLIRRQGQKLGASPMSPEDYRERFCDRVHAKVNRLPAFDREIIVRRLMTLRIGYRTIHELPSDDEVLMAMNRDGWACGKTYYDERKAEAIMMLAESLRIAVYEKSGLRVFGGK